MTAEPARFAYARSVAPLLWMLIAVGVVELLVTHLLLAHWFPRAALVLSAVTAAAIVWLVLFVRSFGRYPVELREHEVVLRVGSLKTISLPYNRVAGVRTEVTAEELRDRGVLNLALIAHPNVLIELSEPMARGRRRVRAVAHRLDAADAFCQALAERL